MKKQEKYLCILKFFLISREGEEISIFYFRTGYQPEHYEDEVKYLI
jgi:hypothetical protein